MIMPTKRNIILDVDSYKNDHGKMLPPDTQYMFSTVVPRKPNKYTSLIKAMGHQYAIKKYLSQKLEPWMLDEAEIELPEQGFEFDRSRFEYILNKYNGYLPLEIRAIPEGMVVPVGVATVTIVNTDPECAWLTSYIETMFLRICWKMTTVASICHDLYNYLDDMMFKHTGCRGKVNYHLHNFGSRGADSLEADVISGMAHLGSGFNGTDCTQANRNIKYFYNTTKAYGISITASEHSVMSAWSDADNRDDYQSAVMMLDLLEDKIINKRGLPIVSIVGDTYDIYRFTKEYIGTRLKDRIIQLGKKGGKIVIRPDSGNPEEVPIGIIKILMQCFGYTVNKFGYKILPSYLGVIQGDGINNDSIRIILRKLDEEKICLENIVFGMGSGLTHDAGRDEFSFSMKATARFDGKCWIDLNKDPITDSSKKSLKGHVTTFINRDTNTIFSDKIELSNQGSNIVDLMETIYYNGQIRKEYSFEDVVARNRKS